jgi:hypothetical protein
MFVDLQSKYDWVLESVVYPSVDRRIERYWSRRLSSPLRRDSINFWRSGPTRASGSRSSSTSLTRGLSSDHSLLGRGPAPSRYLAVCPDLQFHRSPYQLLGIASASGHRAAVQGCVAASNHSGCGQGLTVSQAVALDGLAQHIFFVPRRESALGPPIFLKIAEPIDLAVERPRELTAELVEAVGPAGHLVLLPRGDALPAPSTYSITSRSCRGIADPVMYHGS